MYLWPSVIQNASQIRSLTVLIDTGPDTFDWHFCNEHGGEAVGHLLSSDAFPVLQQLTLEAVPAMPAIIQATLLQGFLFSHRRSLHEVRLKNVFPSLWVDSNEGRDAPRDPSGDLYPLAHTSNQEVDDLTTIVMRLLDSTTKELVNLRTFELSVSLRDSHVDECVNWPEEPLTQGCTGFCKSYALAYGKMCPRAVFEDFAASMNIKLKNEKWDFGEYVMAQGAGQLTSRFAEL